MFRCCCCRRRCLTGFPNIKLGKYCSYEKNPGPYKNFKTFVVAGNIRAFKTCACLYSPSAWKQSGENALHIHGSKTKCSKNNLSANIGWKKAFSFKNDL